MNTTPSRDVLQATILAGVLDKTRQGNMPVSALPTVADLFARYPGYGRWIDGWTEPQFAFDLFAALLALGNPNHQALSTDADLECVFRDLLFLRSHGRDADTSLGRAAYRETVTSGNAKPLQGVLQRSWAYYTATGRSLWCHNLEVKAEFVDHPWLSRVRILAHEARHSLQFYQGLAAVQGYVPLHGKPVEDDYSPAEVESVLFQQTLFFLLRLIEPDDARRMVRLAELRQLFDQFVCYTNTEPAAKLLDNARVVGDRLAAVAATGSTFPLFRGFSTCLAALVNFTATARRVDFVFQRRGDDLTQVEAALADLSRVSADHLAVPFMQSRLDEENAYAHSRLFRLKRDAGEDSAGDLVKWLTNAFSAAVLYPLPRKVKYLSSALRVLGDNQRSAAIIELADDLYCDLYAGKHLAAAGEAARQQFEERSPADAGEKQRAELSDKVYVLLGEVIAGAKSANDVLTRCEAQRGEVIGFPHDMFVGGALTCFREGVRLGRPGCPVVGRVAFRAFENGCFLLMAAKAGLPAEPNVEELLGPTEVRGLWQARSIVNHDVDCRLT